MHSPDNSVFARSEHMTLPRLCRNEQRQAAYFSLSSQKLAPITS